MTAAPDSPVSEITENSDGGVVAACNNLFAAAGWGTIAGLVPLLAIQALDGPIGFQQALGATAFLGLFVGIFTALGMIAIGLPVTGLLKLATLEHVPVYAASGAIAGGLMMLITFETYRNPHPMGLAYVGCGAAAGLACAIRWGRWRRDRSAMRQARKRSDTPTNPFHDMIY